MIVAELANSKRQLTNTQIKKSVARFGIKSSMFFDKLEDIELIKIIGESKEQREIEINIDDL